MEASFACSSIHLYQLAVFFISVYKGKWIYTELFYYNSKASFSYLQFYTNLFCALESEEVCWIKIILFFFFTLELVITLKPHSTCLSGSHCILSPLQPLTLSYPDHSLVVPPSDCMWTDAVHFLYYVLCLGPVSFLFILLSYPSCKA